MDTKIVKLSFQGPVHFGGGRLSGGEPTCDAATLFSALYIEALRTGDADALLAAAKAGDFALSDAFPFTKGALYLPKPMVKPGTFDAERSDAAQDSRERKANKKLGYVSIQSFVSYLGGSFDAVRELENFKLGKAFLQTKVNLLHSRGDDAEPYHVGGYSFEPGAGLYFLVKSPFPVEPLLEQLSYSGLGGKRSSGFGRFSFVVKSAGTLGELVNARPRGRSAVLLSTAAPTSGELSDKLLNGARYRLVRRGGFVQSTTHAESPQKKRDFYLFAPGSMFDTRFDGDVFDVNITPGAHPVYRYARALWMEV